MVTVHEFFYIFIKARVSRCDFKLLMSKLHMNETTKSDAGSKRYYTTEVTVLVVSNIKFKHTDKTVFL